MKEDMTVAERIGKIWFAVFVLRGWLNWLTKTSKHSRKNFITTNAYDCIELNAHSLLNLICRLRDRKEEYLFLPYLFNSQKCEQYFRHARSLTSTQSTVVNFNLLEFLQRSKRIQIQENLSCKLKDSFVSPRYKQTSTCLNEPFEFPTNDEIFKIVEDARENATKHLLEVCITSSNFATCVSANKTIIDAYDDEEADEVEVIELNGMEIDDEEEKATIVEAEKIFKDMGSTLMLTNYSSTSSSELHFELKNRDGTIIKIRKSTFIWMLTKEKQKVSTDRTRRFF